MINRLMKIVAMGALCFCQFSWAADIVISDAYIRESIPGTQVSSAYMTISNNSDKAVSLVGVTSQIAKRIEMHEHVMTKEMMRMQQVATVEVAAHSKVVFQPMGYHLMIFEPQHRLTDGQQHTIELIFSNQTKIAIDFPVKSIKKMHHHH